MLDKLQGGVEDRDLGRERPAIIHTQVDHEAVAGDRIDHHIFGVGAELWDSNGRAYRIGSGVDRHDLADESIVDLMADRYKYPVGAVVDREAEDARGDRDRVQQGLAVTCGVGAGDNMDATLKGIGDVDTVALRTVGHTDRHLAEVDRGAHLARGGVDHRNAVAILVEVDHIRAVAQRIDRYMARLVSDCNTGDLNAVGRA
ncbi:hypothetical protein HC891_18990 [Candidatus Gracilibacteria bacterium]|nr:hypothetical protein [Candidatus Gracilibacteria bacterium]